MNDEKHIYKILIDELEKRLPEDGNSHSINIINALKELKTEFDWFLINLFNPSTGINAIKNYRKIIDGYNKYLSLKNKITDIIMICEFDDINITIKN